MSSTQPILNSTSPSQGALITILIPLYNGANYLHDCLLSVFAQKKCNYSLWKIYIGVNGHSKNSAVYMHAVQCANDMLKLFSVNNIFVYDLYYLPITLNQKSNALNALVSFTNTPWIALLDVDDLWHENKLATQLKYIRDYDVIGTGCVYFYDTDKKDTPTISPDIPTHDITNFNFLSINPIINSSVLIKKKYAYWNVHIPCLEDYELWLRLKYDGNNIKCSFYNCPQILTKHRIHDKSYFNTKKQDNQLFKTVLQNKYKE